MFFHWEYLNETIKRAVSRAARDQIGMFIVQLDDPERAAEVAAGDRRDVQELARRDADRDREGVPARLRRDDRGDPARDPGIVSFVVIVIILAVMANTMAMTARERLGEYATLKALGFGRASSRG